MIISGIKLMSYLSDYCPNTNNYPLTLMNSSGSLGTSFSCGIDQHNVIAHCVLLFDLCCKLVFGFSCQGSYLIKSNEVVQFFKFFNLHFYILKITVM